RRPEAAEQLPEAEALAGLAGVLVQLNQVDSPVWTAKCDVWELAEFDPLELDAESENESVGAACYVDLLPCEPGKWTKHEDAAEWCRQVCAQLRGVVLRNCRMDLVVRAADIGEAVTEHAVTAYASAAGANHVQAKRRLTDALAAFADALVPVKPRRDTAKKLQ
ncbi:MAG TPA: hypothetical protein VGR64_05225, partial [Terracidiphilus sp.]|nr:hypothetical protein [Terracidiphilus sp.]